MNLNTDNSVNPSTHSNRASNTTMALLQYWFDAGQIRAIDKQFGWFLQQLHGVNEPENIDWIAIIGAIVSQQSAQQHACVSLADLPPLMARFMRNSLARNNHASNLQNSNSQLRASQQLNELFNGFSVPDSSQLLALIEQEIEKELEQKAQQERAGASSRIASITIEQANASSTTPSIANLPLILETSDKGELQGGCKPRLFLHKYWCYETRLVSRLLHFSSRSSSQLFSHHASRQQNDLSALRADLARLFPEAESESQTQLPSVEADTTNITNGINWQKVAVALAAQQQLTVITGGPGTGKTTTVAKLLWLLAAQAASVGNELVIKLAAPTGKAAARLSESLRSASSRLPEDGEVSLPVDCTTIHRLLGVKKLSPFFVHHRQNPLSLDVLVVDEASMIDLPLLCKLFEALPDHAQVILLGDNNQLASVEVGSVLGDLCVNQQGENVGAVFSANMQTVLEQITGENITGNSVIANFHPAATALADNIVHLQKSYRFHAQSGIGFLARAVNSGDVAKTLNLLRSQHQTHSDSQTGIQQRFDDIHWQSDLQAEQLLSLVHSHWQHYFAAALQADVNKVFDLLTQLQILCTQRQGEWGVEGINAMLEQYFARNGWLEQRTGFYPGKPIMITENDHRLGLYNGDIGVVLPALAAPSDSPEEQVAPASLMRVWFPATSKSTGNSENSEIGDNGGFQYFLTGQLPRHDTVYAMTTHKSQGSEFAHVVLCMPEPRSEQQKHLLNRELFYTGITRAKQKVSVFASPGAVSHAVSEQCERASGLMERLAPN